MVRQINPAAGGLPPGCGGIYRISARMAVTAEARPTVRRRSSPFERRGVLATALIAPAVLFIALLVGGPLVLAIYLAFTNAIAGSLSGDFVGFENFRNEWQNPIFRDALKNTIIFTIASQAIVLLGAGVLAHFLNKNFRGRWILRFLILLPWAAPISLGTLGFLWIFDALFSVVNWTLRELDALLEHVGISVLADPLNPPQWLGDPELAMATVISVHAWRILPFATVIFLAGLASIPVEVEDAAKVDGATGLKKFWYVTLPLQLPIALVALLFGIVFTATDMTVVYILTRGGPFNETHMLTTWAFQTGIESASLGPGAAISLFLLPVLALVAILMLFFARKVEVT
jgi:multiple sugar transport system permease protein